MKNMYKRLCAMLTVFTCVGIVQARDLTKIHVNVENKTDMNLRVSLLTGDDSDYQAQDYKMINKGKKIQLKKSRLLRKSCFTGLLIEIPGEGIGYKMLLEKEARLCTGEVDADVVITRENNNTVTAKVFSRLKKQGGKAVGEAVVPDLYVEMSRGDAKPLALKRAEVYTIKSALAR